MFRINCSIFSYYLSLAVYRRIVATSPKTVRIQVIRGLWHSIRIIREWRPSVGMKRVGDESRQSTASCRSLSAKWSQRETFHTAHAMPSRRHGRADSNHPTNGFDSRKECLHFSIGFRPQIAFVQLDVPVVCVFLATRLNSIKCNII